MEATVHAETRGRNNEEGINTKGYNRRVALHEGRRKESSVDEIIK